MKISPQSWRRSTRIFVQSLTFTPLITTRSSSVCALVNTLPGTLPWNAFFPPPCFCRQIPILLTRALLCIKLLLCVSWLKSLMAEWFEQVSQWHDTVNIRTPWVRTYIRLNLRHGVLFCPKLHSNQIYRAMRIIKERLTAHDIRNTWALEEKCSSFRLLLLNQDAHTLRQMKFPDLFLPCYWAK